MSEVAKCIELRRKVDLHLVEEAAWQDCLVGARDFLARHKLDKDQKHDVKNMLQNCEIRDAIWSCLDVLGSIASWPSSAGESLDEWKAKRVGATEDHSLLGKAVQVARGCVALQGRHLAGATMEGSEVQIEIHEGGAVARFTGSWLQAQCLPDIMPKWKVTRACQTLVRVTLQQVVNSFADSLALKAFRRSDRLRRTSKTRMGLCDSLVDTTLLDPDVFKVLGKVFLTPAGASARAHAQPEVEWQVFEMRPLMHDLLGISPAIGFCVSLKAFMSEGADYQCTDKMELEELCSFSLACSRLLHTLAFLRHRFGDGGQEICTQEGWLRPEAEAAFKCARTCVLDGQELLKGDSLRILRGSPVQDMLMLPVSGAEAWLSDVESQLIPLATQGVEEVVGAIARLAEEVDAVTPRYDHIISDDAFFKHLAKKQLMGWPTTKTLEQKTVQLAKASAGCNKFHKEMGLMPPDVGDNPAFKERVAMARKFFANAAQALTVLAGVNLLWGWTGPDQLDEIQKFLDKKGDKIPKKLKAELVAVQKKPTKLSSATESGKKKREEQGEDAKAEQG